jgi:hypothetical protein
MAFITDLNPSTPLASASAGTADDELRNIKLALQDTLPNANAAITATPTQINGFDGRITTAQNAATAAASAASTADGKADTAQAAVDAIEAGTFTGSDGLGR